MKDKERAITKDRILKLLSDRQVLHSSEVAIQLNISHSIILVLLEDIANEELIIKKAISTTVPEGVEFAVKITPKGQVFFNDNIGFIGRYKKEKNKDYRHKAKAIAIAVNAIIIIILTYWGIKSNNDKTNYKIEISRKDSIIIKLNTRIDSLANYSMKKNERGITSPQP